MDSLPGLSAASALAAVESLKLGVVPDAIVEPLSVGCDELLEVAQRDLSQALSSTQGGAFRLLYGEYGHGKSHFLDLLERRALDTGFIVARTAFGTAGSTPDSPLGLYRSLMSGLRYPGTHDTGLAHLLGEACANADVFEAWTGRDSETLEARGEAESHLWLSPGILGWRLVSENPPGSNARRLLAWLSGEPGPAGQLQKRLRKAARHTGLRRRWGETSPLAYRSIPRWRSVPQIACYLLGGIGALAHDLGYAGLVLLLDEGEHFQWLRNRQVEHAMNLALGLRAAAMPSLSAAELAKGGSRSHRQVPYRFRPAQHIACFVAMAPQADSSHAMAALAEAPSDCCSRVPTLGAGELRELADRILHLARKAGFDGPRLTAWRGQLGDYIEARCSARRPLAPRQVVKLEANLPDMVDSLPAQSSADINSWIGGGR